MPARSSAFNLPASPARYRRLLLSWYEGVRRPLPWRQERSLYGTWVSEMMLQQTTVETVVPYWKRFMSAFPDVETLAAASREEVLSLWTGLGYYRRAHLLHRAAREVVAERNGELPQDHVGWLGLPGVGPYAGGAIASIGLGLRVPAVDANARRVLTRWLVADPGDLAELDSKRLDDIAAGLVDPERPGDWNEGLMELGALVCRASGPRCDECPVQGLCRAGPAGTFDLVPAPRSSVKVAVVRLGVLVVVRGDRVLLLPPGSDPAVVTAGGTTPVRKDVSGLHRGLWGLPSTPWLPDRSRKSARWPGKIWRPWLATEPGLWGRGEAEDPSWQGEFRHAITRYRLEVQVYRLDLDQVPSSARPVGSGTGLSATVGEEPPGLVGVNHDPFSGSFCTFPSPDHPVSNLVRKSLLAAGWEGV